MRFKLPLLCLLLLIVPVFATTLSTCASSSACYTDYVEVSYTAPSNYVLDTLSLCIGSGWGTNATNKIVVYTWNGTKGSGYITNVFNSTSIADGGVCDVTNTYAVISFGNDSVIRSGYQYWFSWYNASAVGCLSGKTSACGSLTPQGVATSWGGAQLWGYGILTGHTAPSAVLVVPANSSIVNTTFVLSVSYTNISLCSNATLLTSWYSEQTNLIDSWSNALTADGTLNRTILSGSYGTNYKAEADLICNNLVYTSDNNTFSINLNQTTFPTPNNTILTNIYNGFCFYTPLPSLVCNVSTQDIYIYNNGALLYNINATNETVVCIKDRSLDGNSTIRVKTYCSDTKVLIDDQSITYFFRYQFKYIGADFGAFLTNIKSGYLQIMLMAMVIGVLAIAFSIAKGVVR